MTDKLARLFLLAVLIAGLLYLALFWVLRNPIWPPADSGSLQLAEKGNLERHVRYLSSLVPPRSAANREGLAAAADYIVMAFSKTGCALAEQKFQVDQSEHTNLICSFGPAAAPRVVIGAHYDVLGEGNPGADDNASGVAGLLELARLIGPSAPYLTHRLDLVAFTLEEPPHFRTAQMGSYVYARRLSHDRVPVKLMISVEMIGYFSDQPGSQDFPIGILSWFYPDKADFIGIVGLSFERSLVARAKGLMVAADLPVYSINAPSFVLGVDFSDHWSFWQFGFPAIMVTDTAFLRNPNYHRPTDLPETLDFQRMARTVDGLYRVAVGF